MKRDALQVKKVELGEQKIEQKVVKVNETNIEMCQKILNVYIDRKQEWT